MTYDITEEQLKAEFATFGELVSVSIPNDKYTGRPRGCAFIEMSKVAEGQAAIEGLNGKEFKGRTLTVSEAQPALTTGTVRHMEIGEEGVLIGAGKEDINLALLFS